MTAAKPNVLSIPPSYDFLKTLTDSLLAGDLVKNFPNSDDPFGPARVTIFLPTRRACRALSAHLKQRGLVFMPRLRPLGDIDESDLLFADDDIEMIELPPAISPLERQLILSRLILKWSQKLQDEGSPVLTPASPADAVYLAAALARMLDMVANEGLSFEAIRALPPLDLQEHWEASFRFLKIASEAWPAYLAATNREEPNIRRRRLLQAEAARLQRNPDAPVIAAGSTASMPVTADFLAALAHHPSGAVVLPGLDRALDDESWAKIASRSLFSHPQMAMAQFLTRLKITRDDVRHLDMSEKISPREVLLSSAMRPAETTEKWSVDTQNPDDITVALHGVALVEAAQEHEEALSIACLMREVMEEPAKTVALVTPDRLLARRVAVELKRFGIDIDDSAGTPLTETPSGIFARLIAAVALSECACEDMLSLLKHSLTRLGQSEDEAREANSSLERLLFRGFTAPKGSAALLNFIKDIRKTEASRLVSSEQREKAATRLQAFCNAITPFEALLKQEGLQRLGTLVAGHRASVTALAQSSTGQDEAVLKTQLGGDVLLDLLAALAETGDDSIEIKGVDYPALFSAFASSIPVRLGSQTEMRAHIYGLLEARLIRHDRIILGGLNEGTWPSSPRTDPWLSRGMRANLNLPAPEQRIGLSAHDFTQALGTSDAWMTRARKAGGSPSVPSRFVQRLGAVMGENALAHMRQKGQHILKFARALDHGGDHVQAVSRPAPVPPTSALPRRLSVTQVETLLRDPYSIYAKDILSLRKFENLGEQFGAKERGTLIHAILSEFVTAINNGKPVTDAILHNISLAAFRPYLERPDVATYWWPRFESLIPELVAFENERRHNASDIFTERDGALQFNLPGGAFTLTARADRIEDNQGQISLIDFKTGTLPKEKDIQRSFALQLNLQAAMLERGAFQHIAGKVTEIFYAGIGTDDITYQPDKPTDRMPDSEKAMSGVLAVLSAFDNGAPFVSKADSRHAPDYNDYLHLSRVREWAIAGDRDAEGSE